LSFEVNQGQTAAQVDFLSQGSGYTLFLTPTETVLSLQKPAPAAGDGAKASDSVVLLSSFVGANPQPQVVGLDRLAGTSNYFVGSDPSQWHTNIANYGQVEYQNLYPGVDLVFYGNQRQLEYDYVVAPGADPGVIKLAFDGAESLTIDGQGNLVLHTSAGDVMEDAPVVYQESGGVRQPVSGQFVLEGNGQVGFALGAYDHTRPLVIDPILSYSTYLGGTGEDLGNGIAVDTAGDAYVTGYTDSIDFPTTTGAFQTSSSDGVDAFVTKLNPTGTALVYSTYLGGSNYDRGFGIAVDTAGDAYVTGYTESTDFPTTSGAYQTSSSAPNAFVTKLNPTGTALIYSTYLGGTGQDSGQGIAVDTAGDAYVTGYTESTDFPTTSGAFQTSNMSTRGGDNAFVTKLDPTGTALIYSTYLGGTNEDAGNGIAVDRVGNAYVTGYTESTDFPTTDGAFQTTYGSRFGAAFVTELNPTGTALVYSTYLGGTNEDAGNGIAVDTAGNAYVTGYTESTDFPTTTGAFRTTYGGGGDAFVTKLNPTGTALIYSTYLGGTGEDSSQGIALDTAGDAYVTGWTFSDDFPTTTGAFRTTYGGNLDAFVTKLNPTGTALIYSTYLGGTDYDNGQGIAVDTAGNAYVTGITSSSDFPTTDGAFQPSYDGGEDAFVAKFAFEVQTTAALTTSASPSTYGDWVTFTATVTAQGNPVTSGTVNFNEGNTVLASMVPLSASGTATFSTSSLSAVTHTITAFYSGASSFDASSGSVQQIVSQNAALTVNTLADDPSGPTPGYTTLRDAITLADAGTANQYVINFAVTGTIDLMSPLPDLNNNIDLDGPGASNLTVQRDSSAPDFSVFTVDSGVTVSLSGMTMSGGDAGEGGGNIYGYGGGLNNLGTTTVSASIFSNNSAWEGGGISNESGATLNVIDSTFTNNSAAAGGGIYNYLGTATVDGSYFTGNSSFGGGGGIMNYGLMTVNGSVFTSNFASDFFGGCFFNFGTAIVSDCSFINNSATENGPGGGIMNDGTLTVSGSIFTGDSAGDIGGGIYNDGTATVINSTFIGDSASDAGGSVDNGNTSTVTFGGGAITNADKLTVIGSNFINNSAGDGGAIFNSYTATVVDSTFADNSATNGGGIYNNTDSTVTVTGSVFTDNSTSSNGGGLENNGTLTVTDSTFTGNSAGYGGGLHNYSGGTATLTNCTVSGNTSQAAGGGIANYVGNLTLNNTIVAANTSTSTSNNDISGPVQPTSAFNLIGNGSGISNLTDLEEPALSNLIGTTADPINPLLAPLADYGGPTETMALLPGSPAIDAGSVALAVDANGNPLAYDQRGPGFPRILGNSVDIGAYEFAPLSQTISFGPLAGQTYGVAPITLNATDTSDLPVNFTVLSGPATLSGSVLTVTGAGTVEVEACQPGNATYAAATPVDESFTVFPAPLTITPTAGESMTYGGTVPALTYTYTGLVNGDTIATFSGGLVTSATSSSSVGGYPITQGSLLATGNYTIGTFNPGTLTVNAAPLTITPTAGQSMVYGAAVPALTYTTSGFVNSDPASLLTGELGTTATSTSVVGNYLFTLGSLTAGTNYALALAANPPAFVVTPDGTTTQLASSANPSSFGQAVAFTVTVTANAPGAGIPTGSVTFEDGSTTIGTGTLNSAGQATFASAALSVGSHSITAVYSGDPNFIGSTSTALGQTVNKDGSTAAITSSANPSVLNQSISFTVTVSAAAPGSGTPTGTVQFSIDGSKFGSAVTLAGGSATSGSISTLKLGNHTITASYSGDGNFTASTAPSFAQVVNQDNTTTNLVVTVNPSVYGQSISFTASVAAVVPGTGTPTGSVTFFDGSTTLKTVTLTAGAATYTTTKLATGQHTITAAYNGSSTFAISTSTALTQTVNQDGTSTVVTASANPSVYGQSVTFTATVSAALPGSGTPTGTVTFMDGSTTLGSGTLDGSGLAKISTRTLAVGSHSITASYGGDANFITSTSPTLNQAVNQDGTSTVLSSSVDPSVYGQSVTFTATVSAAAPGSGTPTGSVTFMDGSTALGSATLSSGKASLKTSSLAVGSQAISAVYGGDGNFTTSTSAALTQTIQQDATTTSLKSSANPSVFGQSVTFTTTVKAASPGTGTPSGTVTFYDGSTAIGTETLGLGSPGTATFSTASLSVGAHAITAVYGGDGNFSTSTSTAINQGVNQAGSSTAVVSSANPSSSGQSVTFTATVSADSPGSGTPTVTVTFYDGSTALGSATLGGTGTASFTTSSLSVGSHSIKVAYGGDPDFKAGTSAVLKQVVLAAASNVTTASVNSPPIAQAITVLQDDSSADLLLHDQALEQVSAQSRHASRRLRA